MRGPRYGEPGTYVLPVATDFREFLSFVLYCRDANPLSQIWWLTEERFRELLEEDKRAVWPGCETFFAGKQTALERIARAFDLAPAAPYQQVKALQAAFDPTIMKFSNEYYDVLGLEYPE